MEAEQQNASTAVTPPPHTRCVCVFVLIWRMRIICFSASYIGNKHLEALTRGLLYIHHHVHRVFALFAHQGITVAEQISNPRGVANAKHELNWIQLEIGTCRMSESNLDLYADPIADACWLVN